MAGIDAAKDLGYQTNRLARALRGAVAREIAPLGLTARQAAVVLQLAEAQTLPMGDLAERLGIDRPTLTGVVDRLSAAGWVAAERNPDDRRSRLISLTPFARERLPMLGRASAQAASTALEALGEDAALLVALLDKAATALESTPHD